MSQGSKRSGWLWLSLSSVALVPVVACQSNRPFDEKALSTTVGTQAELMMHETGQGVAFATDDNGTVKRTMGAGSSTANGVVADRLSANQPLANALPTPTPAPTTMSTPPLSRMTRLFGPAIPSGLGRPMLRALVGPRLATDMTFASAPTMLSTEEQFDQYGKDLRRVMVDRLFVASNLESKSDTVATYWLHPDPTCRPLPDESDPSAPTPAISMSCQDTLTKAEIRIDLRPDGDGARMTLVVGPQKLELLSFVVHSDQFALEVDLPKAKAASDYLNAQLGDGSPSGTYERLAGKFKMYLKKDAPKTVTAGVSVLTAVDVAMMGDDAFKLAASDPAIAVTTDGNGRTATIQVGLGAMDVWTTWDPAGLGTKNRDLHETIGGIYGKAVMDDLKSRIQFTNVGIGQTKFAVTHAGATSTIFDLNLNADSLRQFSGLMTLNADDTLHLELTPKLDLQLGFDYRGVAADYASPPNPLMETYGLALLGGGAAAILDSVKSTATTNGAIKVTAGTLTLSVGSHPDQTVTVTAGRCLVSNNPAPVGSDPVIGQVTAADCP